MASPPGTKQGPMRLPKKVPRGATLRLEFVNCGRCPKQHGPYWYAYWKDYRGVTRKLYIGKQLLGDTPTVPPISPTDQ
jgi:hypothetical protein